jgi:hypothetical protein
MTYTLIRATADDEELVIVSAPIYDQLLNIAARVSEGPHVGEQCSLVFGDFAAASAFGQAGLEWKSVQEATAPRRIMAQQLRLEAPPTQLPILQVGTEDGLELRILLSRASLVDLAEQLQKVLHSSACRPLHH